MGEGKENRGRSDEARDPNRPIDPATGEKEGLGKREDVGEPFPAEPVPVEEPDAEDESEDEPAAPEAQG